MQVGDCRYMMGHTKEYVKAAVPLEGREAAALKNMTVSGILKEFLTDEIIYLAENPKLG